VFCDGLEGLEEAESFEDRAADCQVVECDLDRVSTLTDL
jgi:hypothetical protein